MIHGRTDYDHVDEHLEHFVPEGWEELDRGICPKCGQTVAWDEAAEKWRVDATLTVLVLTAAEYRHLRDDALMIEDLEFILDVEEGLNRPLEPTPGIDYGNRIAEAFHSCGYAHAAHVGGECPDELEARAAHGDA